MNAYASHLSVLKDKTKVLASEDIFTNEGVLLAKSGSDLNEKVCQNILKFKLLKPLEDTVFLENQLQPKQVFEQIINLTNRDPYLKVLNTKLGKKGALEKCCICLGKYPLLLQKLTVLDMELTDVFNQSLLSGFFAYICGVIEGYEQDNLEENFLAGIVHDIGFLHIDRQILLKKERLNAEEWRNVQSHPIIAYEIVKRIPNFPEKSAMAILEHHENLDGSGYPRGKTVHELGSLGQLINLLDNVIVIYNKKFKPLKRSPIGLISILQINMHSYLPKIVSTIFKLLKTTPDSPHETSDVSIINELINHTQKQQDYISTLVQKINQANSDIGYTHENKPLYSLQNSAINMTVLINSSGLGHEKIDWSQQLADEKQHHQLYKELEDTRLLQGEIIYQLQGYQKSATVFIDQNKANPASNHLSDVLDCFAENKIPVDPAILVKHWQHLSTQ